MKGFVDDQHNFYGSLGKKSFLSHGSIDKRLMPMAGALFYLRE
jgi:hypothetical protein